MNTNLREQLLKKFEDKEYRDAFVAEQIYSRLPLKIRALREDRDLTQKGLGERAGMAQAWVSKLEDPDYGKLTIATLLKVASACDVGLHVDFVPFSYVLDSAANIGRESFSVPSYEHDAGLRSAVNTATIYLDAGLFSYGKNISIPPTEVTYVETGWSLDYKHVGTVVDPAKYLIREGTPFAWGQGYATKATKLDSENLWQYVQFPEAREKWIPLLAPKVRTEQIVARKVA